ncbi:MAG TPA: tetratricopeptide repeat protein [Smithellaceae bacterium]|nr:tetratricopeptide repeat protein [Smithellaceae bacterium]HRS89658.1 tetratricopeptide repeat protein [Smithellaceae bacterium]HRV25211.1 tetratricopeptide repeat protein [Smithellaceae bacterium]
MSYINDALRRLQKEKGSPYEAYGHIVGASVKKPRRYPRWIMLAGILVLVCSAAAAVLYLNILDGRRVEGVPHEVVAPAAPQAALEIKEEIVTPPPATAPQQIKKQTGDTAVIYRQALKRHREGKLAEAKKLYRRVVDIDAKNISALNNLGVLYMEERNYAKAIKYFHDALNVNSKYVDAHYNLACVYAQKKDKDRSLFYLKNAIEFNPRARSWAREDGDLKFLHALPEFVSLTREQDKLP